MLTQAQRLSGKEVRFLTRKRQVWTVGIFVIFRYDQYPNRPFHQLSFHIPLAVSKRAVHRHKIKRMLISAYERLLASADKQTQHFKCFFTIHKMKLEKLTELLNSKDDLALQQYLDQQMQSAFTSFFLQHEQQKSQHFQHKPQHYSRSQHSKPQHHKGKSSASGNSHSKPQSSTQSA